MAAPPSHAAVEAADTFALLVALERVIPATELVHDRAVRERAAEAQATSDEIAEVKYLNEAALARANARLSPSYRAGLEEAAATALPNSPIRVGDSGGWPMLPHRAEASSESEIAADAETATALAALVLTETAAPAAFDAFAGEPVGSGTPAHIRPAQARSDSTPFKASFPPVWQMPALLAYAAAGVRAVATAIAEEGKDGAPAPRKRDSKIEEESFSDFIDRMGPFGHHWTWTTDEANAAAVVVEASAPPSGDDADDVDTAKKMVRLVNLYRAFVCTAYNATDKIVSPYDAVAYGHPARVAVERVKAVLGRFIIIEFPTFWEHYDDTTRPFPDIREIKLWTSHVLYRIEESPYVGERGAAKSHHELAQQIRKLLRETTKDAKNILGKYWRVCAAHERDDAELAKLLELTKEYADWFDWTKIKMY